MKKKMIKGIKGTKKGTDKGTTTERLNKKRREAYQERIRNHCEKCGKAKPLLGAWKGILCDECRDKHNLLQNESYECLVCRKAATGFHLEGRRKVPVCTLCHIALLQQRRDRELAANQVGFRRDRHA